MTSCRSAPSASGAALPHRVGSRFAIASRDKQAQAGPSLVKRGVSARPTADALRHAPWHAGERARPVLQCAGSRKFLRALATEAAHVTRWWRASHWPTSITLTLARDVRVVREHCVLGSRDAREGRARRLGARPPVRRARPLAVEAFLSRRRGTHGCQWLAHLVNGRPIRESRVARAWPRVRQRARAWSLPVGVVYLSLPPSSWT